MAADPPRPLQGGRVAPGLTVRAVAEEYARYTRRARHDHLHRG